MKMTPNVKSLINKLKITVPIVQAPMAGGATTAKLVAAVSNAGGLGSFGAGYLSPPKIREGIRAIRELTDKPFAVSLFVPSIFDREKNQDSIKKMNDKLNFYRKQLGIPEQSPSPAAQEEDFAEQVKVIIEEKVPVFSFTFGIPSPEIITKLKENNIVIMGTATTVAEAVALEKQQCDIVVAQGSEAGGHRASFLNHSRFSQIGTMALVPLIVDHVKVPVLASGGIADGRGLVAALALGAGGVQIGTRFLTCPESGFPEVYKQIVLKSTEESTAITNKYTGKEVRAITNSYITQMEEEFKDDDMPSYPVPHYMTQDIRQHAAKTNNPSFMSIWAGQAVSLNNTVSASQLIEDITKQADETLDTFQFKK